MKPLVPSSLKEKSINAFFWSFAESISNQGITFLVTLILARLLSPYEFGLVGMITIFIALSQLVVDSGFSQALIRKNQCTGNDYSTVFYYSLIIGLVMYTVLFFAAEPISVFFKEPATKWILRVTALSVFANSLSLIQRTIIIRELNFKLTARISLLSSTTAGVIAIWMAVTGCGVWSLVANILLSLVINSLLIIISIRWLPTLVFDKQSFRELYPFGSKLFLSGIIDTIYTNSHNILIGKFFSATDLGFYNTANQFQALPSQNLSSIFQRVSYPLLSRIKDEPPKLLAAFQRLNRTVMLCSLAGMCCLIALAKPLIVLLIGIKWLPAVPFLQLLCLVGIFYPLHVMNLNLLKVMGRSDLFLQLEIIKKIIAIPTLIIGFFWGIQLMIVAMLINTVFAFYLNSYWTWKLIGYSVLDQLKDIVPSFLISVVTAILMYSIGQLMNFNMIINLTIQCIAGIVIFITFSEIFKLESYLFIKNIISEKLYSENAA